MKKLFFITLLLVSSLLNAQVKVEDLVGFKGKCFYDNGREKILSQVIKFTSDTTCEITFYSHNTKKTMLTHYHKYKLLDTVTHCNTILNLWIYDIVAGEDDAWAFMNEWGKMIRESEEVKNKKFAPIKKEIYFLEDNSILVTKRYRDESNKDAIYIGGGDIAMYIRDDSITF